MSSKQLQTGVVRIGPAFVQPPRHCGRKAGESDAGRRRRTQWGCRPRGDRPGPAAGPVLGNECGGRFETADGHSEAIRAGVSVNKDGFGITFFAVLPPLG